LFDNSDLDGVLLDSEGSRSNAQCELAQDSVGRWPPGTEEAMLGMSSPEWAAYMRYGLAVHKKPETIVRAVVGRVLKAYREQLRHLPGAVNAERRLAACWPLGLAALSDQLVIDVVLTTSCLDACFAVTVSPEEGSKSKPASDVYLSAVLDVGVDLVRCAALEGSANGVCSATASGMVVLAIPKRELPPSPETLGLANVRLKDLGALTPEVVPSLGRR
jgi:beta-phosphoglucomutase-like phosphatase (HAD superfamily)